MKRWTAQADAVFSVLQPSSSSRRLPALLRAI
jgi:hypothetical protein